MSLITGLGQSTLAKRLLAVFFACVLVPAATLTVVSYLRVRDQLVDQSLARLDMDSKAAQMSMFERLALADREARASDLGGTGTRAEELGDRGLVLSQLVVTDLSGNVLGTDGNGVRASDDRPIHRALDDAEQEALRRGTLLFITDDGRDVALVHDRPEGRVWATIDSTFLWSSADEYASLRGEAIWCVLDSFDRPIHCPDGVDSSELLGRVEARQAFTFEFDGRPHRGLIRPINLEWQFGQEPWHVLIGEPLEAATSILAGFRRTFLPVALLSILCVLFFSGLQLRRVFSRLVELQQATSRLAVRDFSTTVDMDGTDEISQLAGAFDQMTGELSAQFRLLDVINRVDQAALVHRTLDGLARDLVADIGPAFGGAARAALLINGRDANGNWRGVASFDASSLGGPTSLSVEVSDERIRQLATTGAQTLMDQVRLLRILGDPPFTRELPPGEYLVSPLKIEGQVAGVLAVDASVKHDIRDAAVHARRIADQTALALSNVRRLNQLEQLSEGTLVALARAVDAGSHWTAGHSERVANLTVRLGREMGLSAVDLERLHRGGLLHDVGKIGVPGTVLDKTEPLAGEDFELIRRHPGIGRKILEPIETFADVLGMVMHHHERFDGAGYPDGLRGYTIPLDARMVALADTYDALTSDRPYRKGWTRAEALVEIRSQSGTQFDPIICETFVTMIEREDEALPKSNRVSVTAAMLGGGL